jgi:hypothetical protein
MFFLWSGRHPREASEFFLKLPESIGAKQLESAVSNFAYNDPTAAGDWAAALPPGATRDKLLAQVAGDWMRRGVVEVTQWLDRLPQESGKSAAIEGFAKAVMSTSPDDALDWLRAVPNETERLERLRRVWRQWLDREAALRWVETSPALSDVERKALRDNGERRSVTWSTIPCDMVNDTP